MGSRHLCATAPLHYSGSLNHTRNRRCRHQVSSSTHQVGLQVCAQATVAQSARARTNTAFFIVCNQTLICCECLYLSLRIDCNEIKVLAALLKRDKSWAAFANC